MIEKILLRKCTALENSRTEMHSIDHNSLQKIPKILENSPCMLNFIRNNFPKGCIFRFLTDLATKIEK
jgi:hypothetical protein